jgi:hypothetical protein
VERDSFDARRLHRRQQFAARGFDFGKFRQSMNGTTDKPANVGTGPERGCPLGEPANREPAANDDRVCDLV